MHRAVLRAARRRFGQWLAADAERDAIMNYTSP